MDKREIGNRITWSERAVFVIAVRMMLGANKGRYPKATMDEIEAFKLRHKALLEELIPHLPRGMSAVGAAIAKCAIKYDKARAIEFAQHVKEGFFQGKRDPVWHYYRWLNGLERGQARVKRDQAQTFYMTLAACRAYCENRQLSDLTPAKQDIFEWNEKWEYNGVS